MRSLSNSGYCMKIYWQDKSKWNTIRVRPLTDIKRRVAIACQGMTRPSLKSVKLSLPDAWKGKDGERSVFYPDNGRMRYVRNGRASEPNMVSDQLILVDPSLTGQPLNCFNRKATYPRITDRSLEDLLCGLYECFINVANMKEHSLRYTQAGGYQQFAVGTGA